MTQQCYQHIFTSTNTAHILHQNDFQEIDFSLRNRFPAPPTLKETSA